MKKKLDIEVLILFCSTRSCMCLFEGRKQNYFLICLNLVSVTVQKYFRLFAWREILVLQRSNDRRHRKKKSLQSMKKKVLFDATIIVRFQSVSSIRTLAQRYASKRGYHMKCEKLGRMQWPSMQFSVVFSIIQSNTTSENVAYSLFKKFEWVRNDTVWWQCTQVYTFLWGPENWKWRKTKSVPGLGSLCLHFISFSKIERRNEMSNFKTSNWLGENFGKWMKILVPAEVPARK